MRKNGCRDKSIVTFSTEGVMGKNKKLGYTLDSEMEMDKLIKQVSDPKIRIAIINLSLPPVAHVFLIIKLDTEVRIYDVENNGSNTGFYTDDNQYYDTTGYKYFFNGLLDNLKMSKEHLRFMPSPQLSDEERQVIDYEDIIDGESRGPCLLYLDALLNRYWRDLLEEAYP